MKNWLQFVHNIRKSYTILRIKERTLSQRQEVSLVRQGTVQRLFPFFPITLCKLKGAHISIKV